LLKKYTTSQLSKQLQRVDVSVIKHYNSIEVIIMTDTKSTLNVKIDNGIKEKAAQLQPKSGLSLDEQLIVALKRSNPKRVKLKADENGSLIIDKEKHPDLYDWAVNG